MSDSVQVPAQVPAPVQDQAPAKPKRGRPRKAPVVAAVQTPPITDSPLPETRAPAPPARDLVSAFFQALEASVKPRRGRPKKAPDAQPSPPSPEAAPPIDFVKALEMAQRNPANPETISEFFPKVTQAEKSVKKRKLYDPNTLLSDVLASIKTRAPKKRTKKEAGAQMYPIEKIVSHTSAINGKAKMRFRVRWSGCKTPGNCSET